MLRYRQCLNKCVIYCYSRGSYPKGTNPVSPLSGTYAPPNAQVRNSVETHVRNFMEKRTCAEGRMKYGKVDRFWYLVKVW